MFGEKPKKYSREEINEIRLESWLNGYNTGRDDQRKVSKWWYNTIKPIRENTNMCDTKDNVIVTKTIDCRKPTTAELVKTTKITVKTPWTNYSVKQIQTNDKSLTYWNFTDCPVIEINGGHGQTWIPLDVLKQIIAEFDVPDEVNSVVG